MRGDHIMEKRVAWLALVVIIWAMACIAFGCQPCDIQYSGGNMLRSPGSFYADAVTRSGAEVDLPRGYHPDSEYGIDVMALVSLAHDIVLTRYPQRLCAGCMRVKIVEHDQWQWSCDGTAQLLSHGRFRTWTEDQFWHAGCRPKGLPRNPLCPCRFRATVHNGYVVAPPRLDTLPRGMLHLVWNYAPVGELEDAVNEWERLRSSVLDEYWVAVSDDARDMRGEAP